MFVACGIWCLADVSSVSPSSEQTIYPCDSAEFEIRYHALIRRRFKPLFDTNKPAAAQAR